MPLPIARIRAILGLSQRELALLLNISHSQLAKIEAGERNTPPFLKAVIGQWMTALHLTETDDNEAPLEPSPANPAQRRAAVYAAKVARQQARIDAQKPAVEALETQRQHWAKLEALLPQFPNLDPEGFALLRDRKLHRANVWSTARLAEEEALLKQLQIMAASLNTHADVGPDK